jgi:hypothetical protein
MMSRRIVDWLRFVLVGGILHQKLQASILSGVAFSAKVISLVKRKLKFGLIFALLPIITLAIFVSLRRPSLVREWDEDVRVLAGVDISSEGLVDLENIRDWGYVRDSVVSKGYFDASFDPDDIVELWMYEQILDERGLIAHTFLVFEFDENYGDNRFLGLSVETRRELGEQYSIIGGMLRKFEVTHIWATERDLVRRRVEYLDYPLTRRRMEVPEDSRSRIFTKMAQETAELAIEPRWYNTATNNCTSSLIQYANESEPGAIPTHYSYVLTGDVDDYLESLGYLDPGYSLDVTREYLASGGEVAGDR